jgi:hypothetical protein
MTVWLDDAGVAAASIAMAAMVSNASAQTVATPRQRRRGRDLSILAFPTGSALP